MSAQMQSAILQSIATSGGQITSQDLVADAASVPTDIPLVVITDSLGSKIAFDAIYRLSNPKGATTLESTTRAAGERIFDRTAQVFMEANQLAILGLSDQLLDGTPALRGVTASYSPDPIGELIRQRRSRASVNPAGGDVQVVAFTDPNDLLSYILAPSPYMKTAKYRVVDVIISNEPTLLFEAESPLTHLGYGNNKTVTGLMVCGHGGPNQQLRDECLTIVRNR